ncbi:MAG: tetratricopeptide repeat protein [Candidatus Lindowbacteria bacterium]|nr:tetratricopeptide repeat protein [Candidatus Lindowbacteria bacterium]
MTEEIPTNEQTAEKKERSYFLPVTIGIVIFSIIVYLYAPGLLGGEVTPTSEEIGGLKSNILEDPLAQEERLRLARYYLQEGVKILRDEVSLNDLATDSEMIQYFSNRLSAIETENSAFSAKVADFRRSLKEDFQGFYKSFSRFERDRARSCFEESILLFRQAQALGFKLSSRNLYDLGTAYYQLGPEGYAGAAKYLGEAIKSGLLSTRALTFLGNVSMARGNLTRGIALYRRALELSPEDPVLAFNLALAYKESNQMSMAIDYFGTTLKLYRDKENLTEEELSIILQARLALGWCFLKTRQYSAAVSEFEAVLDGQPESIEGHYWLGVAYEGEKRYEAARAHWLKVKEKQSRFRDVRERLASVERLLSRRRR